MALVTLSELRTNIGSTVRETQINSLIDSYINLTGLEIHNAHPWTSLRRKQTFATVVDQENYNLDEEIDRIAIVRQISTPTRLQYFPDDLFYRYIPDPENSGSGVPRVYRLWEETGFSTNLAAADTVYISSSSTSDGSSFNVVIEGRNSSGERVSEVLTMNGTTSVTSTTTWAAAGLMRVSKSAQTTGTVTVYRTTGATVLSELAPEELSPRFKRLSLYPVPSAVVTFYVEYFEKYRFLVNNTDVPQMNVQNNWLLREGALAKTWEYKHNETASAMHQAVFDRGLKALIKQDMANQDYVPVIQARFNVRSVVTRVSDSINSAFPQYAIGY